jgi:hypothetical protein
MGIVDIGMLPPGETFDRSFFVDIVMDSQKTRAQIPDSNPEKRHFLRLDNPRSHLPIMKSNQITSRGCSIQLAAQILPQPTSGFLGL